jgi:hypothetical protein
MRGARRQNPYYAKYLLIKLLARNRNVWAASIAVALDKPIGTDAETLAMAADAFKRVGDMASAAERYHRAFDLTGEQKYNSWATEAEAAALRTQEAAPSKGLIATLKSLWN